MNKSTDVTMKRGVIGSLDLTSGSTRSATATRSALRTVTIQLRARITPRSSRLESSTAPASSSTPADASTPRAPTSRSRSSSWPTNVSRWSDPDGLFASAAGDPFSRPRRRPRATSCRAGHSPPSSALPRRARSTSPSRSRTWRRSKRSSAPPCRSCERQERTPSSRPISPRGARVLPQRGRRCWIRPGGARGGPGLRHRSRTGGPGEIRRRSLPRSGVA